MERSPNIRIRGKKLVERNAIKTGKMEHDFIAMKGMKETEDISTQTKRKGHGIAVERDHDLLRER